MRLYYSVNDEYKCFWCNTNETRLFVHMITILVQARYNYYIGSF